MGGANWGSGSFDTVGGKVFYFENDGKVWYDAVHCIAEPGWQKELEPYEGPGWEGLPFDDWFAEKTRKQIG